MRVILIAPPNPTMLDPRIGPPLGLLALVAWAREHGPPGIEYEVIDLNVACYDPEHPSGHATHDFSMERCLREIPSGADVYGVQLASMQLQHGVGIADRLRRREPQAILLCGGSHASAMPHECDRWFDVVVTGEGERALSTIVRHIQALGGQWAGERVVRGAPVEPLDELPMPARDLLDWSRYTRTIAGQPATNIITSRGCPNRCSFCQQESLWGAGPIRLMSATRILAEVDHIHATTGIRHLLFLDDSLTARPRRDIEALCRGLAERDVLWRGWTRATLCSRPGDDAMLALMAQSGCRSLCIGVEAGTDRVLRAIGKRSTVADNFLALQRITAAGMQARCSVMVGNPGERWEDVEALVRFVENHRDVVADWILSSYVPLPGTPVWDDPAAYGIEIDKQRAADELYRHFYVVGGEEQSGVVHRYAGDGGGAEEIVMRHAYVQESLLRLAPRHRQEVVG